MTRMEYRAADVENDVLRAQLKTLRAAARELVSSIEKYVRQEELRSALLNNKDKVKKLL